MGLSFNVYDFLHEDAECLLQKSSKAYQEVYRQKFDFLDLYKNKFSEQIKPLQLLLLYDGEICAGCAVFEQFSDFYGSISLFVSSKKYCRHLAKFSVQCAFFDEHLLEIICYQYHEHFYKSFKQLSLIENLRQRMLLDLRSETFFNDLDGGYRLIKMTPKDLPMTSRISYLAHQVSRDYYMYPGMNNYKNRLTLEELAFGGFYGSVNSSASVLLCKDEDVLGYCLVVDVDSCGIKGVPWIFDISIRPEYQGKGLGTKLLKAVCNIVTNQKKSHLGLAVTQSNSSAIQLYENVGFTYLDSFREYIKKY